ncbi:hypothetical protein FUAX_45300 (plasmid) [Fulvitalea axinellae]|uniref:DDE Tnp4 domain-containing protein n=1 Tax=Fulvitalea axinellae TaxID=1182444 RepID=A0AAU9D7V4_9BACT|nr:hypothetical protein FUAX_45300 [Fulvitalea axinellae]
MKMEKGANAKCRALTGLNQDEWITLLPVFSKLVEQRLRWYTLKGKKRKRPCYKEYENSSLPGSDRKLNFALMYSKENPNQTFYAQMFGLSQAKVSEWFSFLLPLLETSLNRLGMAPMTGGRFEYRDQGEEYLLADVTECEVPRKVNNAAQKEEYSGKSKRHTAKYLVFSAPNRKILYVSPLYPGSVHDKTIWDETEIQVDGPNILVDLGFLGADKENENVIIPHKKPKGKELTELQKQVNKGISSVRVGAEHAIGGIKRLKIIRNKIRLKYNDVRERVMMVP